MSYLRPTNTIEVSQVIKKSQFIGNLTLVTCAEEAVDYVHQIKAIHSNANHSCHCFIAGQPEQFSLWGYSDDGEPKGTAGLPMFQVLKYSKLGNVCVVVTRYFGGIKLGTGGIARAYSSTVKLAIEQSINESVELTTELSMNVPFHLTGALEHLIKQSKGTEVLSRDWLAQGQQLSLSIELPSLDSFNSALSPFLHELTIIEPK
jgi:uncharacterized YigZ family protein